MTEHDVTIPSAGPWLSGVVHIPDGMRPSERRAAFLVLHGFGGNQTSSSTMAPTRVLSEIGYVVEYLPAAAAPGRRAAAGGR